MRLKVFLALILSVICAAEAYAQAVPGRMGAGVYIGAFEGDAVYDSGVLYEARYGYSPFDFFNVELSLGVIDTEMYTRQASAASTVNVTTTAPRSTRLTTASISLCSSSPTLEFILIARWC